MIDSHVVRGLALSELLDAGDRRRLIAAIEVPDNSDFESDALAELTERLIAAGAFDEAMEVCGLRGLLPLDRVHLMVTLAEALFRAGQSARADAVLDNVGDALSKDEDAGDWQRAEAMLRVARVASVAGSALDRAVAAAEKAAAYALQGQKSTSRQDSHDASSTLGEAVGVLAELGQIKRARSVLPEIRFWVHRWRARKQIAMAKRRPKSPA
jgi:hypothetical protein